MSNPEIGVNLTQVPSDILLRLVDATEEIRDLLRQKAGQENGTTQQISGASHQGEDSPEVPDATAHQPLNTETANVETDNSDNWPNDETITKYKNRCAKHRSECEKMQVELGCFIAHLGVVGGDKEVIEKAELLRKVLLDPSQCLEKAFDATPNGRLNSMYEVRRTFDRLDDFADEFARSPHQEDSLYPDEINQWRSFTYYGRMKINGLLWGDEFVECLEFIHDVFFFELETAMGSVVEALTTFEEKSASEWLTKQKIVDFESWSEEYISRVFSPLESVGATSASPDPHTVALLKGRLPYHQSVCVKMGSELDHLIAHYGVVGGDREVIEAAKLVQSCLHSLVEELKRAVTAASDERLSQMSSLLSSLGRLYLAASKFKGSLYHQKHAFYFREVKKWVDCLLNGLHAIHSYMRRNESIECLTYVCKDLFTDLEVVMVGLSIVPKETKPHEGDLSGTSSGNVAEELKMFGKESLPKFLVDQMERDTTRYVNLTTIATFFSSVTATTLQFTYAETDSVPSNSLRGVVNLFWFLSLVFSVSSGVNSLLGLTWRKSSIYDSRVPPRLIRMWFDKAPMLFLIIAAVAFVIGLNLFAYLSLQPRYVSFATSILTGLHGMCLLAVTFWFIYQLKHDSAWARWIGKILQWIGDSQVWKWFMDLLISTWGWIRHPRQQYREKKLHLQRNFFWAFGIDNRVARLNYDMDWERDWSGPYPLSKLIRYIAYPIKRCWLVTKKAISDLSRTVRAHICMSFRSEHAGDDIEMGESDIREEAEEPEEISSESLAKNKFRKSLQTVFSEANQVDWIMQYVGDWEEGYEEYAERWIGKCLWGYPALVNEFHEGLRPALIEAREKRRGEREEAEQQETTTEHVDNEPEGVAENETETTCTPAPPDDGSSPLVTAQADGQPA